MNVVGKVGSLISQGVYSVATPFHPFGGAVDVIVVQQQDGTFRSTPWYVRFGKFQGVLKGAEKVVRISVNGVESDFHMYLDNSGEAYFVKEVDEEKGVNLDQDSSKKTGGFLSNGHHVLDHSISDSGVLRLKGEVSSSVVPRIQRTESDGRYYDFHDSFDDSVDLSDYGSNSYETLEGENSVDSKGPQPEMVLVSVDGHILTAPISESEQNDENVQLRNPQFHLGPAEETDICEGNEEFSSGETAWAADYITQLDVSTDDVQSIRRDTNGNDITSTAPLEVCQTEEVSICQSRETLVVEIQDRLTITDSEGVVASGLKKESVFKSCLELQDFGPQTGSPDLQGSGSLLKVKNSSDESNASSPVVDENEREIVIQSDASSPVVDEIKQESVEKSQNIDGLSSTSSPTSSGGHKSPKSELRLLNQEVEKDASGEVDTASSSPSVIDDTERNNEQVHMSVSNGGEDDSRQTTSLEDISKNASEVVEPQTETSSKGDKIHSGLGFEISLCGHELKVGMGLEAAAGVFEAHRISEEYFTNSAPSIIKNQNLVIKFQEMYLTWEKAAPLVLGKAVFGSNLPVERKDAIPVELDQRSPTSGRRWRLWPIPFRRVKTLEHTYSNVSTEEVFLDSESGALVEPTPTSSSEGSPRKQFVRTNVPTNEQIASLNLKDGQNTVTFSFSTRVLGTQQVDAHIYLWKWNARIVISDVDGTITKSDVLGQFMPLVGKDWTQSGVARLFSAIKDLTTGKTIGVAKEKGGLYYLSSEPNCSKVLASYLQTESSVSSSHSAAQIWLQHKRLGHPPFSLVKSMFPSLFLHHSVESFKCDVCELAKHHRVSFTPSSNRSAEPFDLIHSDVWGPAPISNISGAKWFVSFIDDCTRATWIFLMKDKSEAPELFIKFLNMVQTQFGKGIKRIRSDNGKEYANHILSNFTNQRGIVHEFTCVDTPQQNGVAERKNRHLLEVARAILFQMAVPNSYWGEAVLTAAYLINRVPSRMLGNVSPVQFMTSRFPSVSILQSLESRVFGCVAFVHIHKQHRSKLDPRAARCIFVGYPPNKRGYKCYHPPSRKYFVSKDVTFHENLAYFTRPQLQGESIQNVESDSEFLVLPELPMTPLISPITGPTIESPESTVNPVSSPITDPPIIDSASPNTESESPASVIVPPLSSVLQEPSSSIPTKTKAAEPTLVYQRRSKPDLLQTQLQLPEPEVSVETHNPISDSHSSDTCDTNTDDLPIALRKGKRSCAKYPISQFVSTKNLSLQHQSFISAVDSVVIPSSVQEALKDRNWVQAMDEEMKALEKNGTWEIVDRREGKKPVGCRWIYTVKHKSDGTLDRYKARLVAKGYTQTYGIDYEETFAPVAKMNTVRILLSLAAHSGWELQQFDVKNAFLHGNLEEEVYMEIPPGFGPSCGSNKVCRLRKALYGLKQSPRAWFGRFTKAMVYLGYKQSQGDHTLFFKHSHEGKLTILLVYVDDIIITGDDQAEKQLLKEKLSAEFEMKDLGQLKYFLGIEVAYSNQGIFISQRKYILDLLQETGKLGCKPSSVPIEQNHKLSLEEESAKVDRVQYQRLVGKLIYLAHTRPDLAYAVSVVSQFMHDPRMRHLQSVDRILQYLKATPGRGLLFKRGGSLTIEAYTDADYAGSISDRRSTSGFCTLLCGNLVTWRSKKQNVVARSSAEAEFRALAQGICELLWMKIILNDLKIQCEGPMKLFCDNKSTISIAHNPVQHDRTKHIEIDRHFIKEKLDSGLIATSYIPSRHQLADVLTKGLPPDRFNQLTCKLGMIDIHSPA